MEALLRNPALVREIKYGQKLTKDYLPPRCSIRRLSGIPKRQKMFYNKMQEIPEQRIRDVHKPRKIRKTKSQIH